MSNPKIMPPGWSHKRACGHGAMTLAKNEINRELPEADLSFLSLSVYALVLTYDSKMAATPDPAHEGNDDP